MVNDVCLAIAQLPKLVQQHSTDVIVMGHSAGGQLALCAAVKCSSSKLIGALALGPIADLQYAYDNGIGDKAVSAFLGGPPSTHRDLDPCQLPSATIGITIVHGVQDAIAPLAMSENYLSHHANARLVKVESCGHFALIDPQSAAWPIVVEELAELSSS